MPDDQCPRYRRVIVVGNSGAGKTQFGARLAARLEIPFVDLDDEFWGAGWVPQELGRHARALVAARDEDERALSPDSDNP